MTSLDSLKWALRKQVSEPVLSSKQPLSDAQYNAGFEVIVNDSTYQDFIIPQLSKLLSSLLKSRIDISVLEIGPGSTSILGKLPCHLRERIRRYTAFEPNTICGTRLREWINAVSEIEAPFPCLESIPEIHPIPFNLDSDINFDAHSGGSEGDQSFDIILFCHSMYGMKHKVKIIERALDMLVRRPEGGLVVVFHRDGPLHLEGLVSHRMASFPVGVVRVADNDEDLDNFARFVAGFVMQDIEAGHAIRTEWRKVCRTLAVHEKGDQHHLLFKSPNMMVAFTRHATALPELIAQIPSVTERTVKNREAHFHRPAAIVKPQNVRHLQQCVQWAITHESSLTVIAGGHSGHCMWSNVVSVDMSAFDQVHISTAEDRREAKSEYGILLVAEAGVKTGDIVHKAMEAGVNVPLGSRPSVGAGLWLQGGIGHLARLHGLACDHIIGAVVVSVHSGEIFCIGLVPSQQWPAGAVRPENEDELLWAVKGAGTNVGIVVSITFRTHVAPTYLIRNWVVPLNGDSEGMLKLHEFDTSVARELPQNCSTDAYLYWESDQLNLGVTMFECLTTPLFADFSKSIYPRIDTILGPPDDIQTLNDVGLFEAEIYMSKMHGGHGGSKTSAFKRCLFLKDIGSSNVADRLITAIRTRPTPLCYLHLLQGGEAISNVMADATVFGCRDWDFACVITGVWLRDQDGTKVARAAKQWVYDVAFNLLPSSSGAYGADLGPDPRDVALAAKAFGRNLSRMASLKQRSDPHNILAYACPLPPASMKQSLIILVTGKSGAGKDYCSRIWVSLLNARIQPRLRARAVSISDATKRQYAAASGANLERLLQDRVYKEQHRPALTAFFHSQVQHKPRLAEEHFLDVVSGADDVDVLLITGLRDEAPVATLSYLVPDTRVIEVCVKATEKTRRARRGYYSNNYCRDFSKTHGDSPNSPGRSYTKELDYQPSLIFSNDVKGDDAAKMFAETYLLPILHEDLQRLSNLVRQVPDFPRPGIEFRNVLGIAQQPGGLNLCISLLRSRFMGNWAKVDMIICCEAASFILASALATHVNVPLALVRKAGKLPPPTISISKSPSHISSSPLNHSNEERFEMQRDLIPEGASVVVVDDVLATGRTLFAVLQLLGAANVLAKDVSVMVVAEFPIHRGRNFLRQKGFGGVKIQSLLVYGGA